MAEKSGASLPDRGVYRSVPLGSKKTVQSGEIAGPCGAVVGYLPRGPALSTDTASPHYCVSPSSQGPSDNIARVHPVQPSRPIRLWPGNLRYMPGLRAKIRIQPQDEATG